MFTKIVDLIMPKIRSGAWKFYNKKIINNFFHFFFTAIGEVSDKI